MINPPKIKLSCRALVVATAFIHCTLCCHAQTVTNMRNLQDIAAAAQSYTVTDEALIAAIAQRLDDLAGKSDNSAVTEKAQLIRIAASVPMNLDQAAEEAAIKGRTAVLEKFVDVEVNSNLDGSDLLHLASGIIGLPLDQKSLVAFARADSVPNGLRLVALEALFHQPQITLDIRSDLAALTKDEWHFVDPVDVGPRTGELVFPVRGMALKVLDKLDSSRRDHTGQAKTQQPQHRNALEPKGWETKNTSSTLKPSAAEKDVSPSPTSTQSEEPASSTPWSILVVLIVAAIGLLWLLLKNRK